MFFDFHLANIQHSSPVSTIKDTLLHINASEATEIKPAIALCLKETGLFLHRVHSHLEWGFSPRDEGLVEGPGFGCHVGVKEFTSIISCTGQGGRGVVKHFNKEPAWRDHFNMCKR